MKTAIAFSLIAGAAAFAPATNKQAVSTSLAAFEDEIGVIAPTGFFDPLNFCKNADQVQFDRWRSVELKHGRVASTCIFEWDFRGLPIRCAASVPTGSVRERIVDTTGAVAFKQN